MNDDKESFSKEYVEDNQTGIVAVPPARIISEPSEVSSEVVATDVEYGLAKPRRVVIRAKVFHEPQS